MQALKQLLKPLIKPPLDALTRLLRKRQLSGALTHVSAQTLQRDLSASPLPAGASVLVHTSLKAIGFVEGGADAVVDAMIRSVVEVGGGTLMLPTYSIDGTMRNTMLSGRVFDVRTTPSNLGAIPEAFRRRPEVRRSVHPTHSFSALGPQAAWLTADHHLAGSNFGSDTPMMRLMERGGYLMGIGTHLGTVTFYHCLEDMLDNFPLAAYSDDSPFEVRCIDWSGHEHTLRLPAHSPIHVETRIDRPENHAIRDLYTQRLEARAGLRWFPVGTTRGWVIALDDMYRECLHLLEEGLSIYARPQ